MYTKICDVLYMKNGRDVAESVFYMQGDRVLCAERGVWVI